MLERAAKRRARLFKHPPHCHKYFFYALFFALFLSGACACLGRPRAKPEGLQGDGCLHPSPCKANAAPLVYTKRTRKCQYPISLCAFFGGKRCGNFRAQWYCAAYGKFIPCAERRIETCITSIFKHTACFTKTAFNIVIALIYSTSFVFQWRYGKRLYFSALLGKILI